MMTIFNIIVADHRKISILMKKIETTTDDHLDKKMAIFENFQNELLTHAKAEEKAVYDLLKTKYPARDRMMDSYEEHQVIEYLLDELSDLPISDKTWASKFRVLQELVEDHIQEEEKSVFKLMKDICSHDEIDQMSYDIETYKNEETIHSVSKESLLEKDQKVHL